MERRSEDRNKSIIRYNIIGIVMNLALSVFKITAGLMAHSHAVMLDGVNSLSDMISSLITILSAYVAGRRGTANHPLGYGRLEYISSFIVTMIIMYVGARTLLEAVRTILHPHTPPHYTTLVVVIMVVSLVCKIAYGVLMRRNGRRLSSDAMIMTGTDSLGDALISVAILSAMVIYRMTGVDIEHYLCIIIALMIMRTGVDMIKDCINKLLGVRLADEDRKKIATIVAGFDEVLNVSNLMMHNYGESLYVGSLDIEVDENMTAAEISRLSRRIIKRADEQGIMITSVGISGTNLSNPGAMEIWDDIITSARAHKGVKHVHSFELDEEEDMISFVAVPDYSAADSDRIIKEFTEEIKSRYPGMSFDIRIGVDM